MPGSARPERCRQKHGDSQHCGPRHSRLRHNFSLWRAADSAAARNALGWVPQELALYPRLTCRENLQSFGRYHGLWRRKQLADAVAWCLEWATLRIAPNDLSGISPEE
jgi:ABC-type transporter Mla maintaining outer membrane lipid asymmetry ATPase subunit MlaF